VYTLTDLRPMIACHRRSGALATMALYRVPDPWNRGIVQLDESGAIVRFAEKPPRDQVFSDLANAGIYVLEPDVLDRVPEGQVWDFGHDVFPAMLAEGIRMAGYAIEGILIDIGLPEKYQQANRIASGGKRPAYVPDSVDAIGVVS
jgi:mannose-1-phosphate guanylyltransferase/phosphomannomutase